VRYFVEDIPSTELAILPTRDDVPVDLDTVESAVVYVETTALTTFVSSEAITAEWPATSLFTEEGLYRVTLVLTFDDGGVETFQVQPIVVEDASTGWHTSVTASGVWVNSLNDVQLFELLTIARTQIESFAPELVSGNLPPLSYRQAQVMQARNILNAAKSDPSQSEDGSFFLLRPYPLDNIIKQLLRPKRAVPVVG